VVETRNQWTLFVVGKNVWFVVSVRFCRQIRRFNHHPIGAELQHLIDWWSKLILQSPALLSMIFKGLVFFARVKQPLNMGRGASRQSLGGFSQSWQLQVGTTCLCCCGHVPSRLPGNYVSEWLLHTANDITKKMSPQRQKHVCPKDPRKPPAKACRESNHFLRPDFGRRSGTPYSEWPGTPHTTLSPGQWFNYCHQTMSLGVVTLEARHGIWLIMFNRIRKTMLYWRWLDFPSDILWQRWAQTLTLWYF